MFKLTKTQKERGSVEIVILVVVVAAIIGVVAWRIAETMKTQQDTDLAVSTQDIASVATTKSLTIDEWSIEIPYDGKLSDLEYTIVNAGAENEYASLTTKKLRELDANCAANSTGFTPLGAISRTETPTDVEKETLKEEGSFSSGFVVKIDGYSYLYQGPQSVCSDDEASSKLQTEQVKLLKDVITNLRKSS